MSDQKALSQDLLLYTDAAFVEQFVLVDESGPVNFTGWTAHMQVRASADDPTVLLNFTTADGTIVLNTTGLVQLVQSAAVTATVTWQRAVYSLLLTPPGGEPARVSDGTIVAVRGVTR